MIQMSILLVFWTSELCAYSCAYSQWHAELTWVEILQVHYGSSCCTLCNVTWLVFFHTLSFVYIVNLRHFFVIFQSWSCEESWVCWASSGWSHSWNKWYTSDRHTFVWGTCHLIKNLIVFQCLIGTKNIFWELSDFPNTNLIDTLKLKLHCWPILCKIDIALNNFIITDFKHTT